MDLTNSILSSTALIIFAVFLFIAICSVIFIVARYKKADPSQLLVIYGNTKKSAKTTIEIEDAAATAEKVAEVEKAGGDVKDVRPVMKEVEVPLPAHLIQGGGRVVIPIVQGYHRMSMHPIQVEAKIDGLDSQSIRTQLQIVMTTAISRVKGIQQNAAIRFLNMEQEDIEEIIKKISFGEIRGVMTKMPIEQINADRNAFLVAVRESLEGELRKVGFELTNINISEISDDANYIKNIGKNAATRAQMQAEADIAARIKDGNIKIANTKKEESIAIAEADKEKEITVAQNKQEQEVGVAQAEKDKEVQLAETEKERESGIAEQNALKAEAVANANADAEMKKAAAMARQVSSVAESQALGETKRAEFKAEQVKNVAKAEADAEATKNEQDNLKQVRIAQAEQKRAAETIKAEQEKEAKEAEYQSDKRQRAAEANRAAGVTEQKSKIDVANARAEAGKAEAEADKVTETAKVEAAMSVEKTRQQRQFEVNQAQAKAEEERLNATEIVPAQKLKEKIIIEGEQIRDRAILEAEGEKAKIIKKAEAEAEATKMKLEAQAEGEKKLLLAQAEGKEASLLAEAHKEQQMQMASAMQFKEMLEAAAKNPSLAVQYKMVDQYKHIAEAQVRMLEHINLGNVTIYGDSNTGAQFAKSIIEKLAPSLAMVNDGLKGQFVDLFAKGQPATEIPAPKTELLKDSKAETDTEVKE